MKKAILVMGVFVLGISLGLTIGKRNNAANDALTTQSDETAHQAKDEKKPLYWVAPMDPSYRRDAPGKSPMGMDLIPVYDDGSNDDEATIKISPEVINNLGVRTAKVNRSPLSRKISTVGYLDYDETRINHIHVRTEGWIERLSVRAEGEYVNNRQLLFELYAPTLVNAQEEYLQALGGGNKMLLEASKQRLLALDVSPSQIERLKKQRQVSQYIRFYAPQSGILSRLNVREGMYIKPSVEVMSIANFDSVWLLAEVFERQVSWVKTGNKAEARLPSLPGQLLTGEVEYIYPDLDPVTRTLRVRIRFDNTERLLMPNMYAHVDIFADAKPSVLNIPSEALIRGADKDHVILSLGKGRFKARPVTAGMESQNVIEIIQGLSEGDSIVVSSQFLLDSESSLKASFQRMEPLKEKTMEEHHGKHHHD